LRGEASSSPRQGLFRKCDTDPCELDMPAVLDASVVKRKIKKRLSSGPHTQLLQGHALWVGPWGEQNKPGVGGQNLATSEPRPLIQSTKPFLGCLLNSSSRLHQRSSHSAGRFLLCFSSSVQPPSRAVGLVTAEEQLRRWPPCPPSPPRPPPATASHPP
jgi:hypothetical protein